MTASNTEPAAFHVLGDEDTVLGFRFAGIGGTAVGDADAARAAFQRAVTGHAYQVLLLTEVVERMLAAEVNAHRLSVRPPYIVVVGDVAGTKVQRKTLEQTIQEAVGIRIRRPDE